MNRCKIKKSARVSLVAGTLMLATACSTLYDKHVQWETIKPEKFPVLHAIGYAPISIQKSSNETQRMLMAIKASKIAAYSELAEQVYGQQIESKVTMSDLLINNNQLNTSVQGVIRGAKVVKSYPVGDIYTTELQLNFKDVYEIYEASRNRQEIKETSYF